MVELFFAPFAIFMGFIGMLIGLAALIATIYALFDVLFQQPTMETLEKLIWVLVIIFFNIIGVLIYLLVVKMWDTRIMDEVPALTEDRRLSELERLTRLKEQGALTEDEFQEEKERILHAAEHTVDPEGDDAEERPDADEEAADAPDKE